MSVVADTAHKSAGPVVSGVKAHVRGCLNHGHRVIICCEGDVWKGLTSIDGVTQCQYVALTPNCDVFAEDVRGALTEAGPPATGATPVAEGDLNLSPEDLILFQRAFWDCDMVRVKELKEGRSTYSLLVVPTNMPTNVNVGSQPHRLCVTSAYCHAYLAL